MDASKKRVLEAITSTFEDNLPSFGSKYQHHWCLRLWRLKGRESCLIPIFSDMQKRTAKGIPWMRMLGNKEQILEEDKKLVSSYVTDTDKKKKRREAYRRYPGLRFYLELVHYLFLVKTYNLQGEQGIKQEYDKAVRKLTAVKLSELIFAPEMLEFNPTASANTVYYLQYLGIGDYEDKLLGSIRKVWLEREPRDELSWENKIYGLTHLIIAGSYFYQRFLSREAHSWVLGFFEEAIDEIIDRTSPDIVAEVGLCFKLCKDKDNPVVSETQEYILSRFDKKLGYIPHEEYPASLEKAEHRNALAVLAISEFEKLYPGPDLASFAKKEGLGLF